MLAGHMKILLDILSCNFRILIYRIMEQQMRELIIIFNLNIEDYVTDLERLQ